MHSEPINLPAIADAICRRRAGSLAVFLLESYKPFTGIAENGCYLVEPFFKLFCDAARWDTLRNALSSRETIDELQRLIEAGEDAGR